MSGFFATAPDRAVLKVEGPDRIAFLQGLVSNDVALAGQDRAIWAALLTPQGRYLFDFFISEAGETLRLDVEAARLADLARKLSIYRLRSKVTITPAPNLAVHLVWDAPAAIGTPDPRRPELGARVILPVESGDVPLRDAGLAPGDIADWDRRRLALGVPDGTRDLVPEKSILLENGFDALHGVSWTKGCYIGQELTARTKYRGLVKKRLIPVRVEGPLPSPGTPILRPDGTEAGEMRSGRDDLGLALIRLDALGGVLRAGEAGLVPMPPDWLEVTAEGT
jgi:folate-binding protein YgfZ